MKPFETVNKALSRIRHRRVQDHDTRAVEYPNGRQRIPWDGNSILKSCLMTGGAGRYSHHPSGRRAWTVREYAVLQSYPVDHIFHGKRTQQIKQIGNSVPCAAANVLFSSIKKDLEKADGIVEPAITISDSDDDLEGVLERRIVRKRKRAPTEVKDRRNVFVEDTVIDLCD